MGNTEQSSSADTSLMRKWSAIRKSRANEIKKNNIETETVQKQQQKPTPT